MKWFELGDDFTFTQNGLQETLDGGQSFLWIQDRKTKDWIGQIDGIPFSIRHQASNRIEVCSSSKKEEQEIVSIACKYIGKNSFFDKMKDELPWRSDTVLKNAIHAFPDLRILTQDPDLVLLSFLCSSNKRILQIKEMIRLLAIKFGQEISPEQFCPPKLSTLSEVELEDLKLCKLGYRAKYVKSVGTVLKKEPDFHQTIRKLDYANAKKKMCSLFGVGEKVADCVLLFGYQKWEAFPIDTWILKSLEDLYQLKSFNKNQMIQFAHLHYGRYAGYAQQFLFSYIRSI